MRGAEGGGGHSPRSTRATWHQLYIDSQDGTGYKNWQGVGEGGGGVAEGRTDPGGVAAVQSGLYTEAK